VLSPARAVKEGVWGPSGGSREGHPDPRGEARGRLGDRGRCGGAGPGGSGESARPRWARLVRATTGSWTVARTRAAATAGASENIESEHAAHQRRPGPGARGEGGAGAGLELEGGAVRGRP
jgi:hypothetical protein